MTINDLFSLPVGTRIHWELCDTDGEIVACCINELSIVWEDGEKADIARDDVSVKDLADWVAEIPPRS